MDRETKERLYQEQMGKEATERQRELTDRCIGCGAKKGTPHSLICRYRNAARTGGKRRKSGP